jgi:hypothetical protein
MTTLIDRYVSAAAERVPDHQRAEIATEVRGAIAEMVGQRVETGEPEAQSIEHALNELGDPVKLGESYLDHPRYLIGPGWYPTYLSAIKILLVIVLPIIAVISCIQTIGIDQEDFATIISDAVGSVVQGAISIFFWITLAFAIAERIAGPEMPVKRTSTWTVADLPPAASAGRVTLGDSLPAIIALIAFGVLAAAQSRGIGFFVRGASDTVENLPFINPNLAAGWQVSFFALLAVSLVIEIVRYLRGKWTGLMFALAIADSAAWIVYVIALAVSAPIINPELGQQIKDGGDWWGRAGPANTIIAILVIFGVLQALWEGWNGYRRYQRWQSVKSIRQVEG